MSWVIIVSIIVIGLVINGASKRQKVAIEKAEFSQAASDRAAAYVDFIKRE